MMDGSASISTLTLTQQHQLRTRKICRCESCFKQIVFAIWVCLVFFWLRIPQYPVIFSLAQRQISSAARLHITDRIQNEITKAGKWKSMPSLTMADANVPLQCKNVIESAIKHVKSTPHEGVMEAFRPPERWPKMSR